MGLILPQTVEIKIGSSNYQYYKEKGYEFKKRGDFIRVNVLDLPKESKHMVKIVCDICGKEREMWYRTIVRCNKENKLITCGDKICRYKKVENTCMKKYGVKNVFQTQETKNKIVETNRQNHGVDYYTQCKEYKDKTKQTCQAKYGVDNPAQAQEVKNAMKDTCRKKYNCDYAVQSDEVQNKIKATNQKIYGGDSPFSSEETRKKSQQTWKEHYGKDITNPGQVPEVKDKIFDSFQFNGTGPSSRAQRYICHILNGILNKYICGALVDIYMEKEKIVIEHDGGGHFLNDKINKEKGPTKKSLLYEKQREDKIINDGYRMIRFIAIKDRIPSDETIISLIEEFKNSDFRVIRINFEEGTIEKDYCKKWYRDFGKLRKITKENLESFEKQEEDTSEISKN